MTKTYECTRCCYETTRSNNYKVHLQSNKHKGIKKEPILRECKKCYFSTYDGSNWKAHLKSSKHLGGGCRKSCKVCGQDTKGAKRMTKHMLKHANRQSFFTDKLMLHKQILALENIGTDSSKKLVVALRKKIQTMQDYYDKHKSKRGDNARIDTELGKQEFIDTLKDLCDAVDSYKKKNNITDQEWIYLELAKEKITDYKTHYKNVH